ncbi:ankyrin repeat-containing domain protein [Morchella snyderi]|nr:ankyrin repeat-containing domain protein [Morchella snyderi]
MWLRDYLPGDLEHNGYRARILTYGYDTTLIASHSHAEIYHFSKQFTEAVKGARSRDPTRPLILIGHSLGGLVIKEAIIQYFEDSNDSTLGMFAGILFFSVPHKGLADARLLSMVHGQPNENLVRDLCQNSQFLRGLDRCFGHHMNAMGANIISFYETEETRTVEEVSQGKWSKSGPYVRMVTEESVKHAGGSGQYLPMDADHSSIVKFNDRSGQKYQLVCGKLLGLARTISIAAPETKVPCEERIKVCEWLYPGAVDKKHTEIQSKRQENTGGWLLADDRFTSWKGGSGPRLLWGCGIPGAGKTFLSSLVIDVFKASSSACSSTGLAYIYFDYRDQNQQVPIVVLCCLIKQLVASPHALDFPIPGAVRSLYDKSCASGTTPELKDLETTLAASLKLFTEAFFVFDALDECREDIRSDLLSLIHWIAGSGGRIFVTSRPHVAISLTWTTDPSVQRLDLEAKEEDVTVYIEGTIQRHNKARDRITGDLRAKVISRLVGACNGMFLLVHLYLQDLCERPITRDIRRALDRISSAGSSEIALEKAYGRVMDSIRGQHPSAAELGLKVLTWLLTASRILHVDELRMAVAMGDGSRHGDRGHFDELEEMTDGSSLVDVCCGLVMFDHNSNTIKLVHYSADEYLKKAPDLGDLARRHLTVALGLLDYIWLSYIEPEPRRECLNAYGGLIDYTQKNLHTHMQACHHIAPIETLLGFLRNTGLVRYLGALGNMLPFTGRQVHHRAYGPLLEATAWGSTILVNRLLDEGADPYDSGVITPLHVAAAENLVGLVGLWLEKGVGVNATNIHGETPLARAICRGSEDAVRELLSNGADIMAVLQHPSWDGEETLCPSMLELLFKFGLSVDYMMDGGTYLLHAVGCRNSDLVELLLRKGARIHVRGWFGRTPLHQAADGDTTRIARLLLQHGYGGHEEEEEEDDADTDGDMSTSEDAEDEEEDEDEDDEEDEDEDEVEDICSHYDRSGHRIPTGTLVDARDGQGQTPLHVAAERRSPDMLRLLLNHGRDGASSGHIRAPRVHEHAASINARDKQGFTALSYSTRWVGRHRAIMVEMLLDAGADLTVPPHNDPGLNTWLHAAAAAGDVTLLNAALDAGVDPHARGDDNKSPLHCAAYSASVQVVSLLMEQGLTVDLLDKDLKTPLHYARGAATISLLLERGACTGSTDILGNSPLHSRLEPTNDCNSEMISEDVLLLVAAGAEVNVGNTAGVTPVHLAARVGYAGPVSLLLKSGADVGALDVNQMSAMHYAARSHRGPDVISLLMEQGLSIEARDINQRTPLHHAAREQSSVMEKGDLLVRLLVEKGASVDPRDRDGFTPLKYVVDRFGQYMGAMHVAISLIEAGAEVNVHDDGVSLLHLAAQKGNSELLALLVDAGADIDARDSNKRTPLHHAVLSHSGEHSAGLFVPACGYTCSWIRVARQLTFYGADVNAIDEDQNSPFHLAAQTGSKELIALLLDAGADIHGPDRNQRTPLDIAISSGLSSDITEMLVYRCSEDCSANQVKKAEPGVQGVEMDESYGHETPGQHLEEQPARKRRCLIAFPPKSN